MEKGQIAWLGEFRPSSIPWIDDRSTKISYLNESPEAQVKLKDCFALEEHPTICEGQLPGLRSKRWLVEGAAPCSIWSKVALKNNLYEATAHAERRDKMIERSQKSVEADIAKYK